MNSCTHRKVAVSYDANVQVKARAGLVSHESRRWAKKTDLKYRDGWRSADNLGDRVDQSIRMGSCGAGDYR